MVPEVGSVLKRPLDDCGPRLLMLDEPSLRLAPRTVDEVLGLVWYLTAPV